MISLPSANSRPETRSTLSIQIRSSIESSSHSRFSIASLLGIGYAALSVVILTLIAGGEAFGYLLAS